MFHTSICVAIISTFYCVKIFQSIFALSMSRYSVKNVVMIDHEAEKQSQEAIL